MLRVKLRASKSHVSDAVARFSPSRDVFFLPGPSFAAVSVIAPLFFVEGRGSSPPTTKEEVKTPSIYCSVLVFCRSLVLSTPPPPALAAAAAAGICRVLSLCAMPLPRAVSLCHALAACLSAGPCVL